MRKIVIAKQKMRYNCMGPNRDPLYYYSAHKSEPRVSFTYQYTTTIFKYH